MPRNQFILDPTDPTKAFIGSATDEVLGRQLGDVTLGNVHLQRVCMGRACVVHDPSDHHMREWELNFRGDKGVVERQCSHGIGHPDPDDYAWNESQGRSWVGVHGCDGCCRPPNLETQGYAQ